MDCLGLSKHSKCCELRCSNAAVRRPAHRSAILRLRISHPGMTAPSMHSCKALKQAGRYDRGCRLCTAGRQRNPQTIQRAPSAGATPGGLCACWVTSCGHACAPTDRTVSKSASSPRRCAPMPTKRCSAFSRSASGAEGVGGGFRSRHRGSEAEAYVGVATDRIRRGGDGVGGWLC